MTDHDWPLYEAVSPDGCVPAGVRPLVTVAEEEGLTLVLSRQDADRTGLAYDYGTYQWTASYSGDTNNNPAASRAAATGKCRSAPARTCTGPTTLAIS